MPEVLVVAAHPDDEILGCGGTMARHVAEGDTVRILIVADGVTARVGAGQSEIMARESAARTAAAAVGAQQPTFLRMPDNRLDSLPLLDVIRPIEAALAANPPDIVYTHHGGDLSVDHRMVHRAVMTACRPLPGTTINTLYGFEVPSSTAWAGPGLTLSFEPTRFVGIESIVAAKRMAMAAYATEMRPFPHPRSPQAIEALERHRGADAGLPAAEAFVVLRSVQA